MTLNRLANLLMRASILALFTSNTTFAEEVNVVGSIPQTFKQSNSSAITLNNATSEKTIRLLQIELSDVEKERLVKRAHEAETHTRQFSIAATSTNDISLPSKYQVGMNNVPVLDQGLHGTCSTFAVTGAIDAAIGKGDYVSQLCSLQLGRYLEKHGYGPSGWDGAYTLTTIERIAQYGIVNKKKQHSLGCGGLKHYPTYSNPSENSMMEPTEFSARSEFIIGKLVNWADIFNKDAVKTLNDVKEALHNGDRIVLSFLIPDPNLGTSGAVGKYKTWFFPDTWLLTSKILGDVKGTKAGHALLITGYDDDAVVVDNDGKKHKGLLTLRNSWGRSAGNGGNFYMSYDYFKLLGYGVRRFSTIL